MTTHLTDLWLRPLALGSLIIRNRLVMAPLTRMRAIEGDIPNPLAHIYYSQRATAGLIITEATQISALGKGYPATPGIYTQEQAEGWKKVVKSVHAERGKIVLQLWHVGRISHTSLHPDQGLPWAPSPIPPRGQTMNASWQWVPYEDPHEMTLDDINTLLKEYEHSANLALDAGFDGLEVHAANGYLLNQFLEDSTNQRTDRYGGDFEGRSRLLFEVIERVGKIYPLSKIGVRLSPYGTTNDMKDSRALELYEYVIKKLNDYSLAYLHLIEPRSSTAGAEEKILTEQPLTTPLFRKAFHGALISAGGYTPKTAAEALEQRHADAIAFGRFFISNPDLLNRLVKKLPLNAYDRSTFYGGGAKGYVDYTTL